MGNSRNLKKFMWKNQQFLERVDFVQSLVFRDFRLFLKKSREFGSKFYFHDFVSGNFRSKNLRRFSGFFF